MFERSQGAPRVKVISVATAGPLRAARTTSSLSNGGTDRARRRPPAAPSRSARGGIAGGICDDRTRRAASRTASRTTPTASCGVSGGSTRSPSVTGVRFIAAVMRGGARCARASTSRASTSA